MIFTADKIDVFFKSGVLKLLGMDSCRTHHRLSASNHLCIKRYRSNDDIRLNKTTNAAKRDPLTRTVDILAFTGLEIRRRAKQYRKLKGIAI